MIYNKGESVSRGEGSGYKGIKDGGGYKGDKGGYSAETCVGRGDSCVGRGDQIGGYCLGDISF